jgi:hypothetical protein
VTNRSRTSGATARPSPPAELRKRAQWVGWRTQKRTAKDGTIKLTKVPYQVNGHDGQARAKAKTDDPATWATYNRALAYLQHGFVEGIGYVFTADDQYTGVDLDACIHDGAVEPAAAAIVARLDSYTERSPSGTGLHVIVRANLNGSGRKSTRNTPWGTGEPYEFATFTAGKYFTVTGDRLPDAPDEIHDRQRELDAIRAEIFGAVAADPALPPSPVPKPAASSTDTTPLSERIDALREADVDVDQTWLRTRRPPPPDDSPSGWCLSLANYAVRASWTDPQIEQLLRAYRSKHNDGDKHDGFYALTIAKARTDWTRDRNKAREQEEAQQVEDAIDTMVVEAAEEQPDSTRMLDAFNRLLTGVGPAAAGLLQQGRDAESVRWVLAMTDGTEVDLGSRIDEQGPVRRALQAGPGRGLKRIKPSRWDAAVDALLSVRQLVDTESDDDVTVGWLQGYLDGRLAAAGDEWNDAAYGKQPFERDGFIHVQMEDFHRYVKRGQGEPIKRADLQRRIIRIGFKSAKVNCGPPGGRKNETSRTFWAIAKERIA